MEYYISSRPFVFRYWRYQQIKRVRELFWALALSCLVLFCFGLSCLISCLALPRYLENVARRYRLERWWDLLSDVVSDLLECAKKTSNAPDIVNYSLELISKRTTARASRSRDALILAITQKCELLLTKRNKSNCNC